MRLPIPIATAPHGFISPPRVGMCPPLFFRVRSPFVNSLLNRLKGHHASLVGCQAVEGTPELITADSSGIVKVKFVLFIIETTWENTSLY